MMVIPYSKHTKIDHLIHCSFKKSYSGSIFRFFEIESNEEEVGEKSSEYDSEEEYDKASIITKAFLFKKKTIFIYR
jgi:16S rRNA (guanine966-N2)-methyltransferase